MLQYCLAATSQGTFAALALTSKRFLPYARDHLYARPLLRRGWMSWTKADSLLDSLNANGGRLGNLVQSLGGIVSVASHLAKHGSRKGEEFERSIEWYFDMLKACPKLEELELWFYQIPNTGSPGLGMSGVEIALKAREHLVSLRNSLEGSSNVATVVLEDQDVDPTDFDAALRFPALAKATTLRLKKLQWSIVPYQQPVSNEMKLPRWPEIESIQVDDLKYLSQILDIVKKISISLRHLSLTKYPPSIPTTKEPCPPILENYNPQNPPASPPFRFFRIPTRLPIPTTITLAPPPQFPGPNLAPPPPTRNNNHQPRSNVPPPQDIFTLFLTPVSFHCRQLRSINLYQTRWFKVERGGVGDDGGPTNSSNIRELAENWCSRDKLRELFISSDHHFQELEQLDLGILPTIDGESDYGELKRELEARGVRVSWKVCRQGRWCEVCQIEHD